MTGQSQQLSLRRRQIGEIAAAVPRATENGVTKHEDPRAGSSLVPMLVVGLVLIVVGMIGALAIS